MDITLTDMSEFAAAYLDDVVIFSDAWTKHLEHIRKVLDRLMELGLTVKKCKCQWAQGTCTYLGHVVGRGKVQPEICKVEAVKDFRHPQTKRDVRAFLGLAGYYRKFIGDFSQKSLHLSDATKKSSPE